jgi:hypothetical protein
LKIDFNSDFDIIKLKSGLPDELIKNQRNKVERKINDSIFLLKSIIVFVITLGILVIIYTFHQYGHSTPQ